MPGLFRQPPQPQQRLRRVPPEAPAGPVQNAPAELASNTPAATGTAFNASISVKPSAGVATGTGAASNASISVKSSAGAAINLRTNTYQTVITGTSGLLAYYRLNESSDAEGAIATVGPSGGAYSAGLGHTYQSPGAIAHDPDHGIIFNEGSSTVAGGSTFTSMATAFSVEAWMGPETADGGAVFVKWSGAFSQIEFGISDTNNATCTVWAGDPFLITQVVDPSVVPSGYPTHYVVTWDNVTLRLYRNGVEVNNQAKQDNITSTGANVFIGGGHGFKDDVSVYGVALTELQVRQHYLAGTYAHGHTVAPNAGNAAGTGAALNASISVKASAGVAHSGSTYRAVVLADAPLAYYRLGEPSGTTMTDETGSHSGTYTGSPTLGQSGALSGDSNTAVEFSGATTMYGKVAAWTTMPAPPLTLECWIQWDGVSWPLDTYLGGWVKTDYSQSCQFYVTGDGSTYINLRIGTEVGNANFNAEAYLKGGAWLHIVGTIDSGGAARLYFNGALVQGPNATSYVGGASDNPFKVGTAHGDGAKNSWPGTIDEWAVYPTALSAATIKAHYDAGQPYRSTVIDDGPVSYWRLGDSTGTVAPDEVGSNVGTYVNAPTLSAPGIVGGNTAVTFNGTDEYVSVADNSTLDLGDGPLSLECWFKRANASETVERMLISKGENGYALTFNAFSSHRVEFAKDNIGVLVNSSVQIQDTDWHHVVATKNGSSVFLYVDGADVTSFVASLTLANTANELYIGAERAFGPSLYWQGGIDEVAVYNVVLTPAQVAEHYNLGPSDAGGVAYDATVSTVVGGTNAPAELASGTGAALNASISIKPSAGVATGTGTSFTSGKTIVPNAGNAAGTGTALTSGKTVAPNAGNAAGTGTSFTAGKTVAPNAGAGAGTGSAFTSGKTVAPNAGVASGTGTAFSVPIKYVPANLASGTGSAFTASISIKPNAGVGAGTGTASNASASIKPSASAATGTGAALTASKTIAPNANVGTGTGSALGPSLNLASNINAGSGTGTAGGPTSSVAVSAGAGTGTGAANNASVTTNSSTSAPAELASGAGTAYTTSIAIAPNAGVAAGTGAALDANRTTAPNAGLASGTGAAGGASASIAPNAGVSTGVASAFDARGTISSGIGVASGTGAAGSPSINLASNINAGSGTGTAGGPTSSVAVSAGAATGTGSAFDATITTSSQTNAPAELASGTGAAFSSSISVAPNAGAATGSGTAYGAIQNYASPNVATGTGAASNASINLASNINAGSGTGTSGGPTSSVAISAGNAAGTGAAHNATVTTNTSTNAAAEVASGTGAAAGASLSLASNTSTGGGTGAAGGPGSNVQVSAGSGSGSGSAFDATIERAGNAQAQVAAGTGTSYAASASLAPNSGAGAATGAAGGPTSSVGAAAGTSPGTGTAYAPTIEVISGAAYAQAGVATGTGTAYDATIPGAAVTRRRGPGTLYWPKKRIDVDFVLELEWRILAVVDAELVLQARIGTRADVTVPLSWRVGSVIDDEMDGTWQVLDLDRVTKANRRILAEEIDPDLALVGRK